MRLFQQTTGLLVQVFLSNIGFRDKLKCGFDTRAEQKTVCGT